MDQLIFLIKGVIIGFVASIPLGPIGVICVQKTLSRSHKAGFISGLGAAGADTVFAAVAAFFLGVVLSFIETYIDLMKVIGGICVIIVGVSIFLRNPVIQIKKIRANKGSLWSDFISVFLLTLANPAYILMFVALFASFGISHTGSRFNSSLLVSGVFLGAALWWFILTFGISFLRRGFRPRHLLYMNRASGAIIVLLGAIAIVSIFFQLPVSGMIQQP